MSGNSLDIEKLLKAFDSTRISPYSIFDDYIEETMARSMLESMFDISSSNVSTEKDYKEKTKPLPLEDDDDYDNYDDDYEPEQTLEEYYLESYNSDLDC